jgi:hypothetical protein
VNLVPIAKNSKSIHLSLLSIKVSPSISRRQKYDPDSHSIQEFSLVHGKSVK